MYNAKIIDHINVIEALVKLENVTAEVNGYRYELTHTSMYEVTVYRNGVLVFSIVFDRISSLEI